MLVGSPFPFLVTDSSKVSAFGDGLASTPAGRVAQFYITAPGARAADFSVTVTGESAIFPSSSPL